MMRYALAWLAGVATVLLLLFAFVPNVQIVERESYTESQQAGGGPMVECPSVNQVRPTSGVFLTPRIEAPIRIDPPLGGLRFTKPGKQVGSTKFGTHYRAVQMREILQGFSVQTWVELAPVGHDGNTSKPIGWSYWGERSSKESINFLCRFQPLASTARP